MFGHFAGLALKELMKKLKKAKATKGINVIRRMNLSLPRSSLITICKSFVRPHLDCGDVIYDQPSNSACKIKLKVFSTTLC